MKFSLFMMPLHHPTESPSLAFDRDISLIHLPTSLAMTSALSASITRAVGKPCRRRRWRWRKRRRRRSAFVSAPR